MQEILEYFPPKIQEQIKLNWTESVEEIRIRAHQPIILKNNQMDKLINYNIEPQTILEILQKVCNNSIYSYQNQICQGFLTLKGGHRVGIVGSAVIQEGQVINLNFISSLNFRIARQVLGCSKETLKYVLNPFEQTIFNTLLVSPPGRGKTTILRDVIRNISKGIPEIGFKGLTCRNCR